MLFFEKVTVHKIDRIPSLYTLNSKRYTSFQGFSTSAVRWGR
jgi:hypothetical protein